MMKLQDYLALEAEGPKSLIQARIDKVLRKRAAEKLKQEDLTWEQLITAACKAYLQDLVSKK